MRAARGRSFATFAGGEVDIRLAKATAGTAGPGVQVESDATGAVRLAPVSRLIDNADPAVVYTGTWTPDQETLTANDHFGTQATSNTAGSTAELTFTSTGIGLYSVKAESRGIIKVFIDGTLADTIDLYAPIGGIGGPSELVFRSAALPHGQHTIKVECTGTKGPYANGRYGQIDAFHVVNPIIDSASGRIVYSGAWTHSAAQPWTSGDLHGTESYSKQSGDTATTTFQGTGIRVICCKGPNEGIAEILVDGRPPTEVDLYAPTKQFQQMVFEHSGMPDGEHTVTLKVLGRKNASSLASFVVIDAFEVIEPDPYASTTNPGVDLIVSARLNYTRLNWGNYIDPPINLPAGWSATARLRLLP
ncbi:hypothetical protein [Streptomyces erythrochromogenes]|uniref:hypothetical protein n=1 Tax=Streptomyces erythrochromogenes TaxID=285574 RepID=UPI0036FB7DB4